ILVTGANGFIGRNLCTVIAEKPGFEVLPVTRETTPEQLAGAVRACDAVVHLAGVNRPRNEAEFEPGNVGSTASLCTLLQAEGKDVPVIYSSSSQAAEDNPYGRSKRAAESVLLSHSAQSGANVAIYRLPNVFGKWCKPDYNSVVATFCHRLARGQEIRIDDPGKALRLVHVDDVVHAWLEYLDSPAKGVTWPAVQPEYATTVGELAERIRAYDAVRRTLVVERVGNGLERALYSTYVSYLPPSSFSYPVPKYGDER